MRSPALALAIVLLAAMFAPAQQPVQQPAQPNPGQVDAVLALWERSMTSINTLEAKLSRTKINKVFGTTEKFDGTAKYLKPNKASLELHSATNPQAFEKIVCNGTHLYLYAPDAKQILVHKLPESKPGQVVDDNFLSFLFGMKAADAKMRYKLAPGNPPNDKYYYYVDIEPRSDTDKAEFSKARLVLNISTGLPRQLWFVEPNGNQVTWDFNQIQTGAAVRDQEFAQPGLPQGWQMRAMQDPQPARVIRP